VFIVLSTGRARSFDANGTAVADDTVADLAAFVAEHEPLHPRWVWDDTRRWYSALLAAGIRVERCVDLRLCDAIIRHSELTAGSELPLWSLHETEKPDDSWALFELEARVELTEADPVQVWQAQRAAVAASTDSSRISLLLAAESAGALIAKEMQFAGLPWRRDVHEQILERELGARPRGTERPAALQSLVEQMQLALGFDVNPDSPVELLKALRRAGLRVESTRSWELKRLDHAVIAPLLDYKKRARLWSANGWAWLDTWVADGRFRPQYVPGGVVTGRWASSGGGALQLPKNVRGAVIADPGWTFVVADAAQLEPRILAALSGDLAMAEAGKEDMYEGIVASGAVPTRDKAKVAMLGAMYGATTGESGRLMPALTTAFPRAIALVEQAARAGELGHVVSTRLGRSSPQPSQAWRTVQGVGSIDEAADRRARGQSRGWGRFTRNFVVQGTAAEWALCWMANLRNSLWALSDAPLGERPHLVFFLHDEVVVHTPIRLADEVALAIHAAAEEAGRLLFGSFPVRFPVTTAISDNYAQAK
jgi:DNA polymerase I